MLDNQNQFNIDENEGKFIRFVEKWTSCELPENNQELLEKVKGSQIHKHTKSCKKKSKDCRFGFPRLPSKRTLIAKPNPYDLNEEELKEMQKKAKKVLTDVKEALIALKKNDPDPSESLDDFIQKAAGVTYEEYEKYLRMSERGKIVILKRTVKERNVNNYQETFLSTWNANLDVQVNGKGTQEDPRGPKGSRGDPRGPKGTQKVPRGPKVFQGDIRGPKGTQET